MGRSGSGRIIAIVVSIVVTLAISGLLYLWFRDAAFLGDDAQSTFEPASNIANTTQDLYVLVFWLAGSVFVAVMAVTLAFSLMFREQEGAEALQTHGNTRLELLWTFIPVVIVAIMAVPTFKAIVEIEGDPPAGALEVEAIGHQWWFEFVYDEAGVTTAGELHLPVDRPVHIRLRSNDVIHSFWVPRLAGKVDMVPGHENDTWFTPNEVGEFRGQCAEFCGLSHANMRFRVFVDSQADFDAWVANQGQDAVPPSDDAAIAAGAQQFLSSGCVGCHTVNGVQGAVGKVGPNLTHVGARTTIAGATLPMSDAGLSEWLRDPPEAKPGSKMPDLGLSEEQISNLVAYLMSLD